MFSMGNGSMKNAKYQVIFVVFVVENRSGMGPARKEE